MNVPEHGALGFDLERFYGSWHIIVTNYGYWRTREQPAVSYAPLAPKNGKRAFRDTLRFEKGGRPGTLGGVDVELENARFLWRGDGLLRIIKSPWWVLLVDAHYAWAVTYFGRSNVGTKPGMDVYARSPDLSADVMHDVLARVRGHSFLRDHASGLYATVQRGLSGDRYAELGVAAL